MSTKSSQTKSLDVQSAVKRSITAFGGVFPQEAGEDLRLEEVKLNDQETEWITTVSFRNADSDEASDSQQVSPAIAALLGSSPSRRRPYKSIRLRSSDGKLIGIVNAN